MRSIIYLMIFLLTAYITTAAEIHGTIYDLALDPVDKVVVHIDSKPEQTFITQDGQYTFEVKPGTYQLYVHIRGYAAKENITIVDDGSYNLDLILYPSFEEEDALAEQLDFTEEVEPQAKETSWIWLYIVLLLITLIIITFLLLRKQMKKRRRKVKQVDPHFKATIRTVSGLDQDAQKIMMALSEHDGRMNQREIKKLLPYSEAKISLIITELESKGLIEKIRHGRANIIKLK